MTSTCDICELPIEATQPRYGALGFGDHTGPKIGESRHYSCHTARYGRPDSRPTSELFADLRGAMRGAGLDVAPAPRPAAKVPYVTKGELNRSSNAAREFHLYDFISEMGRRRAKCDCPFCGTSFTVFVWSLSGGGKRCPTCRAMFTSSGSAYPLVGNEDL